MSMSVKVPTFEGRASPSFFSVRSNCGTIDLPYPTPREPLLGVPSTT